MKKEWKACEFFFVKYYLKAGMANAIKCIYRTWQLMQRLEGGQYGLSKMEASYYGASTSGLWCWERKLQKYSTEIVKKSLLLPDEFADEPSQDLQTDYVY